MALNVSLQFPRSQLQGLTVEAFALEDAVSELFELTLEVESTDPAIDMGAVVGEPIVVGLADEPLLPEVRGIVRRVRQLSSEPTGMSKYELVVVPPHWLTTRRKDHRIFADQSVPEIVAAVLAGYGERIAPPVSKLGPNHARREYTVQYGETDHDFIFRLLADEGIASFFDHANQSAWTLVDDTTLFAPSLPSPIPFIAPSNLNPQNAASPHVSRVVITSNVETSAVAVRDYDFEKPQFNLQSRRDASAIDPMFSNEGGLETYEFAVGDFTLQNEADARAAQLLGEARALRRVLTCGSSFALGAGTRMSLFNHPRSDVGGDMLVVRARATSRSQLPAAVTTHVLECVDAATAFRPPRRPKPRVFGTHTAFVVGAPGEEIDVDGYGRVQVEFRWDRRDLHAAGTSRRVRVSQGWAGAGFGFVMLPRVNEEVVISYLDGDPDEPLIVGRVHNAIVASPLNLPQDKTISVWKSRSSPGGGGFNEILMQDAAGAELLGLRAQRDYRSDTGRNSETNVGNDDATTIGGSQKLTVTGGQALSIGGGQNVGVGGSAIWRFGSLDVTATALSTTAMENHVQFVGGDFDATATNHWFKTTAVFEVAAPVAHVCTKDEFLAYAGDARIEAKPGEIKLWVGGSSLTITDGKITIVSPLIELNP